MKYKILVVDDDKELVKMLCSYFNMKQYETITATDGIIITITPYRCVCISRKILSASCRLLSLRK